MRASYREGSIGALRGVRVAFTTELPARLRTWRVDDGPAGGGAVLDLTVHSVDLLRFLLNEEVITVSALTAREPGGATDSEAVTALRLSGGAVGVLHESFSTPASGTAVELHGTEGCLLAREAMLPSTPGTLELRRREGIECLRVGRDVNPYCGVLEAFVAAVAGNGVPSATGGDGRASLRVALGVAESAATGRAVDL